LQRSGFDSRPNISTISGEKGDPFFLTGLEVFVYRHFGARERRRRRKHLNQGCAKKRGFELSQNASEIT
jgi:hypothetical protein